MRHLRAFAFCVGFAGATQAAAQVVPDGTTATTVLISPTGSVTVGIAPADADGTSLNRYDDFNVAPNGVALDNRAEGARTIVNEVTSTRPSRLAGSLEVLGQTAHVIVANPNGIVIDGGRFINTGRVALTTGRISNHVRPIAPGVNQTNVVASVTGGTILIEGGGLSGQMDAVDLIAHQIRINGEIRNDSPLAGSGLTLTGGHSKTEFDSSVLPGNTTLTWSSTTAVDHTADGAVLVDILRPGVIRANHIRISVSDKGAGVRIAGKGFAGLRDFSLQANGTVDVAGGTLSGATGLTVVGQSLRATDATLAASAGPVQLTATKTGSDALVLQDAKLTAESLVLSSVGDISALRLVAKTTGSTETTGFVLAEAKGSYSDLNGDYSVAKTFSLRSGARLSFGKSVVAAGQSVVLDAKGQLALTDSKLTAYAHVLVDAAALRMQSTDSQTALVAQNGSLILSTTGFGASNGDLVNHGGLLQGGTEVAGVKNGGGLESNGAVTLRLSGGLTNRSTSQYLAKILAAGGDLVAVASADIVNDRGQILAKDTLSLSTPGKIDNIVTLPPDAPQSVLVQSHAEGARLWWTLFTKRATEDILSYDYGSLARPEWISVIGAEGDLDLKADSIRNQGGMIYSTAADVSLNARRIETTGIASGQVQVRKTCRLVCTYDASGEVHVYGGQIIAGQSLDLVATDLFTNRGGITTAKKDISISADRVLLEALELPTLVWRPTGLYNFWTSRAAWVFLRDQYGTILAETGHIAVRSPHPVRIVGGSLSAPDGVDLANGKDVVRLPEATSAAINHQIGLLRFLPLLWD